MKNHSLILSLVFLMILSLSSYPVLAYTDPQPEEVRVIAAIIGFDKDQSNLNFIILNISKVVSYNGAKNLTGIDLSSNQTIRLAFLWGDKQINASLPPLTVGDTIIADFVYHNAFTSHTGHLYSYELICKTDEQKIEGICVPTDCPDDEILVSYKCIRLECSDDERPLNHRCVGLNCTGTQVAEKHGCVELDCADEESAANHTCNKLSCRPAETSRDHACVPLFCGLFRKPSNHACASDPLQILIFSFILVSLLTIFYESSLRNIVENRIKRGRFSKSKLFLISLFILSLVILSIPLLIRFFSRGTLLIGEQPYLHLSIAKRIISGELRYSLFSTQVNFYHLLLAYLGTFFGLEYVALILPLVMGAVSLTLFYSILRNLLSDTRIALLATLLLLFSPAFFYLSLVSTPDILLVPLLLLSFILLLSGKRLSLVISWLILLAASLHDPFVLLLSVLLFLIVFFYSKGDRRLRKWLLIILVLVGISYHAFAPRILTGLYLFRGNILRDSVTDLGGLVGFGIFYILLILGGFVSSWSRKRAFYPLHLAILMLIAAMLLLNENRNIYLNLLLTYFAALGLVALLARKWETPPLRTLTIIIVLCGLLFSTLSYTQRIITSGPDQDTVSGLKWLSTQQEGKVLSYPNYQGWIEYYGEKPVFVQLNTTNQIFYSRNLAATKSLLTENNISYILIDDAMRNGLIWTRNEQGLLFLFRNNETFKRIYSTQRTEIWEYIGKNANTN